MKYVFGPLESRRLGKSLGINLFPGKICNFDCVYCQLGPTVRKTSKKILFRDQKKLFRELSCALKGEKASFITFSGLGEPTLISNLGNLIKKIKGMTSIPVAVITNSSLMGDKKVRDALSLSDVVLPSLDAVEEEFFRKIDNPHELVKIDSIIRGLIKFRKEFKGKIWLEIMLLKRIKLDKDSLLKFKVIITQIRPDKVHLVSPVRVANRTIVPKDRKTLLAIKRVLGDNCYIA